MQKTSLQTPPYRSSGLIDYQGTETLTLPLKTDTASPTSFSFIERHMDEEKEMCFLKSIQSLRYEVWKFRGADMTNLKSKCSWGEKMDQMSYLIGVYQENKIVGTGRLSLHHNLATLPDKELYVGLDKYFEPPIASLNRIVVHPDFRRLGIGRFMVVKRMREAIRQGAKSVACDCPAERATSMEKMGFNYVGRSVYGKIFKDVKFHVMTLNLNDERYLNYWNTQFEIFEKSNFQPVSELSKIVA